MKSVLISIKPKWCELIANEQKTIEVRKSRPKLEIPFKCYIYCTLPKTQDDILWTGNVIPGLYKDCANGKVIGEFVCDHVYQYSTSKIDGQDIFEEDIQKQSCLSKEKLEKYEYSAEPREGSIYLIGLYCWKISDLVIYDRPRELSEFHRYCGGRPITRPPQSWCYVEDKP